MTQQNNIMSREQQEIALRKEEQQEIALGEISLYPVSDLKLMLRACSANEALMPHDPRYHDFMSLRGDSSVVTELADTLEQELEPGKFHHQILCGHRGSGKSTELLALKEWADRNGFLTISMDLLDYFGPGEINASDLYLIVAESVERALREEVGSPLPDDRLEAVRGWFHEVINEVKESDKSEASVEGGAEVKSPIPSFVNLFVKFRAKRQGSTEHLKTVREKLRPKSSTLVDSVGKLLNLATEQLLLAGRSQGFLLIFDSLDRYEEKTIKALLQDSAVLSSLSCHVVYTMHINLMYRAERAYWDIYSRPPVVLPMLALRERNADWRMKVADSPYSEEAVNAMLVALNKRIRVELLFEVPEDARLLIKMSGGCLRDLLHLVNLARTKSRKDLNTPLTQITTEGVEKAIAEYRLTLTEGLEEADYQRLAALAQQKSQEDRLDEHIQRLLNKRVVLRYSRKGIRWTDIHPLVIETEGFQHACRSTKPQITSG